MVTYADLNAIDFYIKSNFSFNLSRSAEDWKKVLQVYEGAQLMEWKNPFKGRQ